MIKQAVILAGGLGTRLGSIVKDVPKPMVQIHGRPFLHWQIEYLKHQGVTDVLLLVSTKAGVITEYFDKQPVQGVTVTYCHETTPMGTGGALKNALAQLQDDFFLVNGDSFLPISLPNMHRHSRVHAYPVTVAAFDDLHRVPVPANLKVKDLKVLAYTKGGGEEGNFNWVDAGVYAFKKDIVATWPDGKFDMESRYQDLIAEGKIGIFPVKTRFFDIGTPERLKVFEDHIHDYF